MRELNSVLKKVWCRLKLACLVVKGIPPSRLNPGDAHHALQAELASARAETNRLAAALADASLDPSARIEELSDARTEIMRLKAELKALTADTA